MEFDIEVKNGILQSGSVSINIGAMPEITKEEFFEKYAGQFAHDKEIIWRHVIMHREVIAEHNKQMDESTGKPSKKNTRDNG
jgi:hypothetical protein